MISMSQFHTLLTMLRYDIPNKKITPTTQIKLVQSEVKIETENQYAMNNDCPWDVSGNCNIFWLSLTKLE
jgi:hypothetical protein